MNEFNFDDDPEKTYVLIEDLLRLSKGILENSNKAIRADINSINPEAFNEDYDCLFDLYGRLVGIYNFLKTNNLGEPRDVLLEENMRNIINNVSGHLENLVELAVSYELRKEE